MIWPSVSLPSFGLPGGLSVHHAHSMPVAPHRSMAHFVPGNPKLELLRCEDLPHLELVINDLFLDLGLQCQGFFLLCPDIIGLRCGVRNEPPELIPLIEEVISQWGDVVQIAAFDGFQLLHLFFRQLKVVRKTPWSIAMPAPHPPLSWPLSPCNGYSKDKKGYEKDYDKPDLHLYSLTLDYPNSREKSRQWGQTHSCRIRPHVIVSRYQQGPAPYPLLAPGPGPPICPPP